MSQDNALIRYITPAELTALMTETGMIAVQEMGSADGKPVIHAALKVVNAQTGEQIPGGLPFSVVMFKNAREPGYSNIAIGAIIPVAEMDIALPRDYFNFCNQRFRFTRVFPLDDRSFVLQMDMFVRNATREYVKFNFGVWATLFSQVLFELLGRGKDSLVSAAEVYAAANTDLSEQYVSTLTTSDEPAAEETAVVVPEEIAPAEEAAVIEPEAKLETLAELEPEPVPEPQEPAAIAEEKSELAEEIAEPVEEKSEAVEPPKDTLPGPIPELLGDVTELPVVHAEAIDPVLSEHPAEDKKVVAA